MNFVKHIAKVHGNEIFHVLLTEKKILCQEERKISILL